MFLLYPKTPDDTVSNSWLLYCLLDFTSSLWKYGSQWNSKYHGTGNHQTETQESRTVFCWCWWNWILTEKLKCQVCDKTLKGESCSPAVPVEDLFFPGQATWSILSVCFTAQLKGEKQHRSIRICHTCSLGGRPQRSHSLSRTRTHLASLHPSFPSQWPLWKRRKWIFWDTVGLFQQRWKKSLKKMNSGLMMMLLFTL